MSWSLRALAESGSIDRFILVIRDADRPLAVETLGREAENLDVEIVLGGQTRHQSELLALRYLAPSIASSAIDMVLIHDGARPLLSPKLVSTLVRVASARGTAIPGLKTEDIRRVHADGTLELAGLHESMVCAQTPQVFAARTVLDAYERASFDGFQGTDTASCVEAYSDINIHVIPGDPWNIKITYPSDLFVAESILRTQRYHLE